MATIESDRRKSRVFDESGYLVSSIAPAQAHGRSTGYVFYGCLCPRCQAWRDDARKATLDRRAHNRAIIDAMRAPCTKPQAVKIIAPRVVEPVKIEPIKRPEPATRAALPLDRVAPVIASVRSRITSVELLAEINKAYFEPQWTSGQQDGRERRVHETMEVVVGEVTGHVIFFRRREVGEGEPELLTAKPKSLPKAKGGRGGTTGPVDQSGLLAALKAAGCATEFTGGGHIKVTRDGKSLILPNTASDWRSLKNSLAQARKDGLL